jgi:hypothetical protein
MKRKVIIVSLAIGICLLVLPATMLVVLTQPQAVPLPNPNGYDDFIRAGRMLPDVAIGAYRELSSDDLRDLVSTNKEAVALLRVGLTLTSRVPPINS